MTATDDAINQLNRKQFLRDIAAKNTPDALKEWGYQKSEDLSKMPLEMVEELRRAYDARMNKLW